MVKVLTSGPGPPPPSNSPKPALAEAKYVLFGANASLSGFAEPEGMQ